MWRLNDGKLRFKIGYECYNWIGCHRNKCCEYQDGQVPEKQGRTRAQMKYLLLLEAKPQCLLHNGAMTTFAPHLNWQNIARRCGYSMIFAFWVRQHLHSIWRFIGRYLPSHSYFIYSLYKMIVMQDTIINTINNLFNLMDYRFGIKNACSLFHLPSHPQLVNFALRLANKKWAHRKPDKINVMNVISIYGLCY